MSIGTPREVVAQMRDTFRQHGTHHDLCAEVIDGGSCDCLLSAVLAWSLRIDEAIDQAEATE